MQETERAKDLKAALADAEKCQNALETQLASASSKVKEVRLEEFHRNADLQVVAVGSAAAAADWTVSPQHMAMRL